MFLPAYFFFRLAYFFFSPAKKFFRLAKKKIFPAREIFFVATKFFPMGRGNSEVPVAAEHICNAPSEGSYIPAPSF